MTAFCDSDLYNICFYVLGFRCGHRFTPEGLSRHRADLQQCQGFRDTQGTSLSAQRPPSPKEPHPEDVAQVKERFLRVIGVTQGRVQKEASPPALQEPQVSSTRTRESPGSDVSSPNQAGVTSPVQAPESKAAEEDKSAKAVVLQVPTRPERGPRTPPFPPPESPPPLALPEFLERSEIPAGKATACQNLAIPEPRITQEEPVSSSNSTESRIHASPSLLDITKTAPPPNSSHFNRASNPAQHHFAYQRPQGNHNCRPGNPFFNVPPPGFTNPPHPRQPLHFPNRFSRPPPPFVRQRFSLPNPFGPPHPYNYSRPPTLSQGNSQAPWQPNTSTQESSQPVTSKRHHTRQTASTNSIITTQAPGTSKADSDQGIKSPGYLTRPQPKPRPLSPALESSLLEKIHFSPLMKPNMPPAKGMHSILKDISTDSITSQPLPVQSRDPRHRGKASKAILPLSHGVRDEMVRPCEGEFAVKTTCSKATKPVTSPMISLPEPLDSLPSAQSLFQTDGKDIIVAPDQIGDCKAKLKAEPVLEPKLSRSSSAQPSSWKQFKAAKKEEDSKKEVETKKTPPCSKADKPNSISKVVKRPPLIKMPTEGSFESALLGADATMPGKIKRRSASTSQSEDVSGSKKTKNNPSSRVKKEHSTADLNQGKEKSKEPKIIKLTRKRSSLSKSDASESEPNNVRKSIESLETDVPSTSSASRTEEPLPYSRVPAIPIALVKDDPPPKESPPNKLAKFKKIFRKKKPKLVTEENKQCKPESVPATEHPGEPSKAILRKKRRKPGPKDPARKFSVQTNHDSTVLSSNEDAVIPLALSEDSSSAHSSLEDMVRDRQEKVLKKRKARALALLKDNAKEVWSFPGSRRDIEWSTESSEEETQKSFKGKSNLHSEVKSTLNLMLERVVLRRKSSSQTNQPRQICSSSEEDFVPEKASELPCTAPDAYDTSNEQSSDPGPLLALSETDESMAGSRTPLREPGGEIKQDSGDEENLENIERYLQQSTSQNEVCSQDVKEEKMPISDSISTHKLDSHVSGNSMQDAEKVQPSLTSKTGDACKFYTQQKNHSSDCAKLPQALQATAKKDDKKGKTLVVSKTASSSISVSNVDQEDAFMAMEAVLSSLEIKKIESANVEAPKRKRGRPPKIQKAPSRTN